MASSAATTAAEPPLDPPGIAPKSHGLRVIRYAEFSVDDPHRKLIHVSLANHHAPLLMEFCRHGGIVWRHKIT